MSQNNLEHEKHAIYLNKGFEVGLLKKEKEGASHQERESIDPDHIRPDKFLVILIWLVDGLHP